MHNASTTVLGATGLYAVRMEANHQPQTVARAGGSDVAVGEVQGGSQHVERSHKQMVDQFPSHTS